MECIQFMKLVGKAYNQPNVISKCPEKRTAADPKLTTGAAATIEHPVVLDISRERELFGWKSWMGQRPCCA